MTCSQYLSPFISAAGGFLVNENATTGCEYCSTRTADEFLGIAFSIFHKNRWRDLGILAAFAVGNVSFAFCLPPRLS
jgi:ATP-binding cassette subfamily G (WHITE) protein 2 (SNQ2)